jgi:hypothetical protein
MHLASIGSSQAPTFKYNNGLGHPQVFVLDFASNDPSPPVGGSIPVPERFNRLAWGNKPSETLPCSVSVCCCSSQCSSGALPLSQPMWGINLYCRSRLTPILCHGVLAAVWGHCRRPG